MSSLKALFDTARQRLMDDRVADAVALLDEILDTAPAWGDALLLRGLVDCRTGRLMEGLARIGQALSLPLPPALSAEERARLEREGADAVLAAIRGDDLADAARLLAALRRAGLKTADIDAVALRLPDHVVQGAITLYQVGDHIAAERRLRAALDLSPDHPEAIYILGLIRMAMDEKLEALDLFARAAPRTCNAASLQESLGHLLRTLLADVFRHLQAGALPEAERILKAVLAAQPGNTIALTYRAMLEYQRNDAEAAISHVTAAIDHGARAQITYRLACLVNIQLERFRDASAMQTAAGDLDTVARLRTEREAMRAPAPPRPDAGCADLVLGAGFGYGVNHLNPFVRTLREVAGYRGDVVLLVTVVTPDMVRFFNEYRVDYIVCDTVTFIPTLPANARLIKYYDVLKQMRLADRPARRVLLTDVRDVIFQAEPFDYAYDEALFHTLYLPDYTIADSPTDLMWFRRAYGDAVADRVAGLPLACCGTVLGTGAGILEYVSVFLEQYLMIDQDIRAIQFLDQTIHNHILHHNLVGPARILENHDVIGTLMLGQRDFSLDANFRLTGANGKVPGILHGYDRQPDMLAHIRRVYGGA